MVLFSMVAINIKTTATAHLKSLNIKTDHGTWRLVFFY
jgi:hypothetical protein